MSKERELLERVKAEGYISFGLYKEIKELLAQPEQENLTPRQGLEEYKKGYAKAELDLKLERINHDDILDRSIDGSFEYKDGFMDGVMFAENHHGIGVNDE